MDIISGSGEKGWCTGRKRDAVAREVDASLSKNWCTGMNEKCIEWNMTDASLSKLDASLNIVADFAIKSISIAN